MYRRYVALRQLTTSCEITPALKGAANPEQTHKPIPHHLTNVITGGVSTMAEVDKGLTEDLVCKGDLNGEQVRGEGTGEDGLGGEKPQKTRKSHKSSVCIIPPESVWDQIQDIRRVHDKVFARWMPHINMLYPFLPDYETNFVDSEIKIKSGLSKVLPFRVAFTKESFGYFSHRKSATLWLKPLVVSEKDSDEESDSTKASEKGGEDPNGADAAENISPEHHPSVLDVQDKLEGLFPEFKDLSTISERGFQPHLSLGQFKPREVEKAMVKFQETWQDITFEVNEIYMISRADFDDPFHIRHAVPLGTEL